MKIANGMLTHKVAQGVLSLEVPNITYITDPSACTDYPDEWFCKLIYWSLAAVFLLCFCAAVFRQWLRGRL